MHSTLVRLQNVFGFFTTVAFTVASVIALSSFISPQNPSASISLQNVQLVMGRPHYYSPKREEYAHIKFDLNAGTSPTQITTMLRLYKCNSRTNTLMHRSQLALQLEHQASLRLPQSRLPLNTRLRTAVRSHHLGCHPRFQVGALAHGLLCSPRQEVEAAQAIRQEARRVQIKDDVALSHRRTAPREQQAQIQDHRYNWQAGQQDGCHIGARMECAAMGRRIDLDELEHGRCMARFGGRQE